MFLKANTLGKRESAEYLAVEGSVREGLFLPVEGYFEEIFFFLLRGRAVRGQEEVLLFEAFRFYFFLAEGVRSGRWREIGRERESREKGASGFFLEGSFLVILERRVLELGAAGIPTCEGFEKSLDCKAREGSEIFFMSRNRD